VGIDEGFDVVGCKVGINEGIEVVGFTVGIDEGFELLTSIICNPEVPSATYATSFTTYTPLASPGVSYEPSSDGLVESLTSIICNPE